MKKPGDDGWSFIAPDGSTRRRQRNPEVRVPDLDNMNAERLERFLARCRGLTISEIGRLMFPNRPLGVRSAAQIIYNMATFRLKLLQGRKKYGMFYESAYERLPQWARFRERYDVLAAVEPGKKFRKHPPKPKP